MKPPVICLMGPTASGKTALAVSLVDRLPCDIVSVDSAMVYRGMDIGTAKPGPETLAKAPHRLIDICDPADSYSAARFCSDARCEVEAILGAGRIPLLVGGTGLYFRAFEQGLSALPAASHHLRQRISAQAQKSGWAALHERLRAVDPDSAARIHPNDPQRLQRALEVYELTGRPMSQLFEAEKDATGCYRFLKIVLAPADRTLLHERAKSRFHAMLQAGLIDEVRGLYARSDLHADLPAIRMVGYRQIWRYLAGELDYETMITHAIAATRQLAKRQLTWFRGETDARWFDAGSPGVEARAVAHLETALRPWQDCNIL